MSKTLNILEATRTLTLRSSYAGIENSPKHLKMSQAIAKKYKSFNVVSHSDKGVDVEMSHLDAHDFIKDHEKAGIGYLIDD
jgi:hypothetical protein